MPKNKVNNNIKLKSGGGLVNSSDDGLSVDTSIYPTIPTIMQASDNSVLTANTERETTSTGETIKKKFTTRQDKEGTVRIKFSHLKTRSYSSTANYIIRVNGVIVAQTSNYNTAGYIAYSADIPVPRNSYITVGVYISDDRDTAYIKDCSISYDLVAQPSTAAAVITD